MLALAMLLSLNVTAFASLQVTVVQFPYLNIL